MGEEYINLKQKDARNVGIPFLSMRIMCIAINVDIETILRDGWYEVKQVGSHHQYKHPTKAGKVTIPEHKGKISKSIVNMFPM